ncbi:bifunctional oligoribonuclease/PAP phosphatase NrnA [bacterium SCSIO 12741]|nr:bifunctional oligoribonuclease/PAP phosphatase NrnA [bacterium SCSIO 12741]
MSTFQYAEIKEAIQEAQQIVIISHKSPDGDAIGSSLGLAHVLRALDKEVTVTVPDAFPQFLQWMPGQKDILRFDLHGNDVREALTKADLIFTLDFNALHRIGEEFGSEVAHAKAPKILVDHHREPSDFYTYAVHDIESCSTAQLVYELIEAAEYDHLLNVEAAECLYSGILTDSGSFRFPSTSARTHEIVARLIDTGLNISKVYNKIYDNNSLSRIRLLGYVLGKKLKVNRDFSLAYITLSLEEMNTYHYKPGDTEGFVNYALSVSGIRFACIMKEMEEGVKMSFRSKGNLDVNQFSRRYFSGGGHLNAAGGVSPMGLQETEQHFVEVAKGYVDEWRGKK